MRKDLHHGLHQTLVERGSAARGCKGLWYSTVTDMDFCLVHGKSHDNRGFYLIPYNGVINGIVVVNGYFTKKHVSTHVTTVVPKPDKKTLFVNRWIEYQNNIFGGI